MQAGVAVTAASGDMRPLGEVPAGRAAAIDMVLCDIDDTLTTEGRIEARVLAAMERLQRSRVRIVPVTGRPAGWCDHIARMWPVDAVVGENGAFFMRYDHAERRMIRHDIASAEERRANRRRLDVLAEKILAEVPGTALASDQPYRIADLAIDFREDVQPLDEAAVARIVAIFEAAGARAKVSSIHVNGWFGDYDKASTAAALLAGEFSIAPDEQLRRAAFIGDSPNDEPLFAAFPLSIGVANIRTFAAGLKNRPAFVTPSRSGAGFVEFAETLLALRAGVEAPRQAVGS